MKNDLPYFSHDNDAHNHPKMQALLAQFGPAGYGQFWILNEQVAKSSRARLDLSRRVNKGAVASALRMTIDQLDAFLSFLSDPEIDLVKIENDILTTDRTQKDFESVMDKREAERHKYRKARKPDYGNAIPDVGNAISDVGIDTDKSRVDKSRVEEKEEKSAQSSARPFSPDPEPGEEDQDPWSPDPIPEAPTDPAPKPRRFQKPTLEEVRGYCRERGNFIDARAFMDFYESKGWLIGKSPMKSWEAAIRTWEAREESKPQGGALALRSDAWTEDDLADHRRETDAAMAREGDELEKFRQQGLAGTALGKILEVMT